MFFSFLAELHQEELNEISGQQHEVFAGKFDIGQQPIRKSVT